MARGNFWSVSALACAAGVTLASCGGGSELLAAVAFIGSAGGDWREDGNAQAGFQPKDSCGAAGNERCFINIQTKTQAQELFATAFDVDFTSSLASCPASGSGRIDGKNIVLNGCFNGAYVTVNEALSSDGALRMFFDFSPVLAQGVWVEIQDGRRRFAFSNNNQGCEFSAAGTPAVTVSISNSNLDDPAGPFETTIASFAVSGEAGGAWSGRFVGVSGMRLTRGNQVMELERRNQTASPACP